MKKDMKIVPVILAGGIGSRLWPLSRAAHPKPFLKLQDGESLLQKTFKRASALSNCNTVVTVTNRDLFFYVRDEIAEISEENIVNNLILEPIGRDTTAAIASAVHWIQGELEDALVVVLPADHLIENTAAFHDAFSQAVELSGTGKLVTFGIKPSRPETAYGYIKHNKTNVIKFVEKPDAATAQRYLRDGDYLWNSGMFCFSAKIFLDELQSLQPEICERTRVAIQRSDKSAGASWKQIELSFDLYNLTPKISIDFSVFENSNKVAVVPCSIGWSDIGSWNELGDLFPVEGSNRISGDVIIDQAENCIITTNDRLVVAVGIEDLIIADTSDALLVASKKNSQDIKNIVSILKRNDRPEYLTFPTVHRPWGNYTVLQEAGDFKIKRIEVKPGARLSLQSHKYRSEHWVVVEGVATVTIDEKVTDLEVNQSTYIPLGAKHRLENNEREMLVMIEVQCGKYLGEDDIIRYDDVYGRIS